MRVPFLAAVAALVSIAPGASAGKPEPVTSVTLAKVGSKADKWADSLKDELKADRQKIVDAAQAALDKVAETKATDAEKARKDLAALASKLKGTGLEDKAKQLLAE